MSTSDTTAVEGRKEISTGRRIWLITSIIISALILLLAVGGILGTWIGRGYAIDAVTALMDGIDQLAASGRETAGQVDGLVSDVRRPVGEVIAAADQIAANISDTGLVRTLLPQEKDDQLVATANRIRDTSASIFEVLEAGVNMYQSVNNLPFVSLPGPDPTKIQQIRDDVAAIQAEIDGLVATIQAFRDQAAGTVSRVSEAADQIDARLATTQTRLAELDQRLATTQERARQFKEAFPLYMTVAAIVLSLIQLWVGYGMVNIIRAARAEMRSDGTVAVVVAEPDARPTLARAAETAIEPAPEMAVIEAPEKAIEPAPEQDVVAVVMAEAASDEEQ